MIQFQGSAGVEAYRQLVGMESKGVGESPSTDGESDSSYLNSPYLIDSDNSSSAEASPGSPAS